MKIEIIKEESEYPTKAVLLKEQNYMVNVIIDTDLTDKSVDDYLGI